MDALHEIQKSLHTRIANSYKNFKQKGAAKMTKSSAKVRPDGLEADYEAFVANHNKILSSYADFCEDCYYERKAEFVEFLTNLEEAERAPQQQPVPAPQPVALGNNTSVHFQSLPKIDIPKFSGKYIEWKHFRDVFRSMIHRRTDLSSVIKFYYLTTHVTDEALDKIKHYPLTEENYERAWTALTEYYENTRRLVTTQVSEIFAIKAVKSETSLELRRLYNSTFNALEYLESLDRPVNEWSDLIVFLTVNKLDSSTRRDWEKELGNSHDPPTMIKLKDFLTTRIATLESIENGNRMQIPSAVKGSTFNQKSHKENSHSSIVQSFQTTASESKRPEKCSLCSQSHYIVRCNTFMNKTPQQRKEIVEEKKLCYNCLGSHLSRVVDLQRGAASVSTSIILFYTSAWILTQVI